MTRLLEIALMQTEAHTNAGIEICQLLHKALFFVDLDAPLSDMSKEDSASDC